MDLKKFEGAIEDYSKSIEIDSMFVDAYYNRGNSKYFLRDFKGAIDDYSQAIEIDPKYAEAYNNRSFAKDSLKDFEGAANDKLIYENLSKK